MFELSNNNNENVYSRSIYNNLKRDLNITKQILTIKIII